MSELAVALSLPDTLESDLIRIRRELHAYPEVLFDVDHTTALIIGLLRKWGLEVQSGVGKHFGQGVVGILHGAEAGETILLRADIDALPVQEEHDYAYASRREGYMHACGHDAHTAMLLGAAKVLSRHREQIRGTIKFVFQPAEEGALRSPLDDRWISGGRDMIEDGILQGVSQSFAMHVWPDLPVGTIGIHKETAMAASCHFAVHFQGTSGHHSAPHLSSDAIIMAARFVNDMQIFMTTGINPAEAKVLSFGTLHAGTVKNVIAGESEVTGTFRAFRTETVERITKAIVDYAHSIACLHGGKATITQRTGTVLNNEASAVYKAKQAAQPIFGIENVLELEQPFLAGEDFALYTQHRPGVFAFIGCRPQEATSAYPLHHPKFDIDESVLLLGAKMHIQFALNALA